MRLRYTYCYLISSNLTGNLFVWCFNKNCDQWNLPHHHLHPSVISATYYIYVSENMYVKLNALNLFGTNWISRLYPSNSTLLFSPFTKLMAILTLISVWPCHVILFGKWTCFPAGTFCIVIESYKQFVFLSTTCYSSVWIQWTPSCGNWNGKLGIIQLNELLFQRIVYF